LSQLDPVFDRQQHHSSRLPVRSSQIRRRTALLDDSEVAVSFSIAVGDDAIDLVFSSDVVPVITDANDEFAQANDSPARLVEVPLASDLSLADAMRFIPL
jgi:hypothetical protein